MNPVTLANTIKIIRMIVDIGVIWLVFFYALRIVRNNSRTMQIFKGIMILLITKGVSDILGLSATSWLVDTFVTYGFLAVIIIFQPEIRGLLEKIGQSNVLNRMSTLSGNELHSLVDSLVEASVRLSKEQIGALMTIEQGQSLSDYIKTGTKINATVSTELLCSIFVPLTPLHDGAVIIQGNRISCASAYFPPTNKDLPTKYGARHRAALGMSEINDSLTIVVSEETGGISIAENGKLVHVNEEELRSYLLKAICVQEVEAKPKNKSIKFDFMNVEEPSLENDERMNVMKTSRKAKKIDASFSEKPKLHKKDIVADVPEKKRGRKPKKETEQVVEPANEVENGGENNGKQEND